MVREISLVDLFFHVFTTWGTNEAVVSEAATKPMISIVSIDIYNINYKEHGRLNLPRISSFFRLSNLKFYKNKFLAYNIYNFSRNYYHLFGCTALKLCLGFFMSHYRGLNIILTHIQRKFQLKTHFSIEGNWIFLAAFY